MGADSARRRAPPSEAGVLGKRRSLVLELDRVVVGDEKIGGFPGVDGRVVDLRAVPVHVEIVAHDPRGKETGDVGIRVQNHPDTCEILGGRLDLGAVESILRFQPSLQRRGRLSAPLDVLEPHVVTLTDRSRQDAGDHLRKVGVVDASGFLVGLEVRDTPSALTKVNFNACDFIDGLPVTLRFADDVVAQAPPPGTL